MPGRTERERRSLSPAKISLTNLAKSHPLRAVDGQLAEAARMADAIAYADPMGEPFERVCSAKAIETVRDARAPTTPANN